MKTPVHTSLLVAMFALAALPLHAAPPKIVAYGGASHDAPENTLASTKLAWEQKADAVATHIQLTRDGKIIVLHDKNAKRKTGRNIAIERAGFEELRKLDAGAWKGAQFAGEKLPTLDEQIALIPPGKRMFVDIRTGPEIVPALADCLQRCKAGKHNITITSSNYEALKAVREELPELPVLYVVGFRNPKAPKPPPSPQPTLDEVIKQANDAKLTGVSLQTSWPLTPDDARKIKDAGLELHVWIINHPGQARRWINLGAESLSTRRPGLLREQLKL